MPNPHPKPQPTPDGHRTAGGQMAGPMLFARYAFGPNRLGLCGPDDWQALADAASAATRGSSDPAGVTRARVIDRALRRLALDFEGALPYLQLIASANGIGDPLDARVVEAYWIGNRLAGNVDPALLAGWLDQRFKPRLAADEWRWLASKPAARAMPTHAFHVLEVFSRVGSMRGGEVGDALRMMDACRIRWGRVTSAAGRALVVAVRPLEMAAGKLVLGPPRAETVQQWLDVAGTSEAPGPGDIVSIHWGWVCEALSERRAQALARQTLAQLSIANQTI